MCKCTNHYYAAYPLLDEIRIGRNEGDIQIHSRYISSLHALIKQGRIIDMGSTNGIYLNHRLVQEAPLQEGDFIELYPCRIIVGKHSLFIEISLHTSVYMEPLELKKNHLEKTRVDSFNSLHLEIDLPVFSSFSAGNFILGLIPTLFMSCTMLLSSSLSNHVITSSQWVLYIGMFISMGCIPILIRLIETKKFKKKEKENNQRYIDYLDSIQTRIQQEISKEEEYERNNLTYLHTGLVNQIAHITFQLPKVNYEMELNPLYQAAKELVSKQYILHDVPSTIDLHSISELRIGGEYIEDYLIYLFDYFIEQDLAVRIIGELPHSIDYLRFLHCLQSNSIDYTFEGISIILSGDCNIKGRKIIVCKEQLDIEVNDHTFFPIIDEDAFLAHNHPYFIQKSNIERKLNTGLLEIIQNRNLHLPHLSIPIGVNKQGHIVELDLHEKGHGPHGLIAGMTGSGKSEFLITLILALSLSYCPDIVSFILIDYKGGGLSDCFMREGYRLPHLRGVLTNLSEGNMERIIYALKKEVEDREKLFSSIKQKRNLSKLDIDDYIALYLAKQLPSPLAHLIIIVDEFAELKMQYEDLIQELIHISRVGRSLGIHLILATQKPSGVVNQQIWSNASFHICLKVQDVVDSQEMLHQKDGAYLSKPGEFYMQLGYQQELIYGQAFYEQKYVSPFLVQVEGLPPSKLINFPKINECDYILQKLQTDHSNPPLWLDFDQYEIEESNQGICLGTIDDYKHVNILPLFLDDQQNYLIVGKNSFERNRVFQIIQRSYPNETLRLYTFQDANRIVELTSLKDSKEEWLILMEYPLESLEDFYIEKQFEALLKQNNLHFVVSIDSTTKMKYSLMKYFQYKLLFRLQDMNEYRMLLTHNQRIYIPKKEYHGLIELEDDIYEFKLRRTL